MAGVTGVSNNQNTSGATAASGASTPAAPGSGIDNLANENTFLKLMIAQIQNQDPMNPTDSMQFLTQLAQFTTLEQNLQMKTDLDGILSGINRIAPADNSGQTNAGQTGGSQSSTGQTTTNP